MVVSMDQCVAKGKLERCTCRLSQSYNIKRKGKIMSTIYVAFHKPKIQSRIKMEIIKEVRE